MQPFGPTSPVLVSQGGDKSKQASSFQIPPMPAPQQKDKTVTSKTDEQDTKLDEHVTVVPQDGYNQDREEDDYND